jgi:uncharacterized protein (TIGR00299 family) protein
MIGYLDLPSGISGDMFLGCLVDAGWSIEQLRATLEKLKLPAGDWSVEARDVMKGALRAKLVDVKVAEPIVQQHRFVLNPSAQGHDHPHRNLHDIRKIIIAADLHPSIKDKAIAVFTRLGYAEAKVHGTTIEQIHFHEVGALDAIVDIVGSVAGVHELGIEKLYASPLPAPRGWTMSQHGKIPLPAPATLELLSAASAPTVPGPGEGELVTPTGAALVCELARFQQPSMSLAKVAIGAGQRDTEWPNVARLWLGDDASAGISSGSTIVQIETNIDDMNPQFYGPLSDRLFAAGALDVWMIPIQMKKNRPAVTLGVLAPAGKQPPLIDIILRETTTLGVRVTPVERFEAQREIRTVETQLGAVRVKVKRWEGAVVGVMPEFDDCRHIAESSGKSIREVHAVAMAAAGKLFSDHR